MNIFFAGMIEFCHACFYVPSKPRFAMKTHNAGKEHSSCWILATFHRHQPIAFSPNIHSHLLLQLGISWQARILPSCWLEQLPRVVLSVQMTETCKSMQQAKKFLLSLGTIEIEFVGETRKLDTAFSCVSFRDGKSKCGFSLVISWFVLLSISRVTSSDGSYC